MRGAAACQGCCGAVPCAHASAVCFGGAVCWCVHTRFCNSAGVGQAAGGRPRGAACGHASGKGAAGAVCVAGQPHAHGQRCRPGVKKVLQLGCLEPLAPLFPAHPVGPCLLQGHTEGLTHLNAKGDGRCVPRSTAACTPRARAHTCTPASSLLCLRGRAWRGTDTHSRCPPPPSPTARHLISNSKDQTIRLWDTRVSMRSDAELGRLPRTRVPSFSWDYRWMTYPGAGHRAAGLGAEGRRCVLPLPATHHACSCVCLTRHPSLQA